MWMKDLGKIWGDLDADFVWLVSNPTEDESTSDSTVDLSGKSRTRCAKSQIKQVKMKR